MTIHRIAVIGGTGPQGKGLAYRFARHGHSVTIGSRVGEKALAVAAIVSQRLDGVDGTGSVTGATNAESVKAADLVVLAVPYDGHDELVASLAPAGKTVISCVNPLAFDKRGAYGTVINGGEGSNRWCQCARQHVSRRRGCGRRCPEASESHHHLPFR